MKPLYYFALNLVILLLLIASIVGLYVIGGPPAMPALILIVPIFFGIFAGANCFARHLSNS